VAKGIAISAKTCAQAYSALSMGVNEEARRESVVEGILSRETENAPLVDDERGEISPW